MLSKSLKLTKTALLMLCIFICLTGILYPSLVTVIAQLLFSSQANGSLLTQHNSIIGSTFIGQAFTEPKYFWGRPSATSDYPYNAKASGGSNLSPANPELINAVKHRIKLLMTADPTNHEPIPVDLVTASGSGLDPEISPAAAFYQINRVAKARKLPVTKIKQLVEASIQKKTFGFLGEPRVNVLLLNLALDQLTKQ